ncbi:unnamed protein product [Miscanthus lutarioriparius]|uniref:DUF4219 domain-containing protein n=1 Tax=Miscanthus lutarioriparius TaxID=422564 RepID=A0A811SMS9_9POAL|nr:unnamed protein product [Miscanthus lutarioriparius]
MSIVASGSGGGGEGARGGGEARQIYPTLTNTNYTSWCIRVQAIMEDREEWEIVEPEANASATAPTAAEAAKMTAKEKKIKANLLQCIPDDLLMQVAKKKTGKVWDSLKVRQMQQLGGSIGNAELVKKLFDIVPERYLTDMAGIEQFYDLKTIAFDEAVGRLKAFEERKRRGSGSARSGESQVLLTQAKWEARQKSAGGDSSSRGKNGGGRGRGRGHGGGNGGHDRGGDTGKDGTVDIQGRGTIVFEGKHGDHWVLSNVYYIPKLRSNLVSLGQLTEIGHRIVLDDDLLEVLGDVTPHESWTGRKPSLGHLKIFGLPLHMPEINAPHLKKLDDRSRPLVYFGVEEGSKAHRLFDPNTNKIIGSVGAENLVEFVVETEADSENFSVGDSENIVVDQQGGSTPSSGSSSGPIRYRNLNDVYSETVEIELVDSEDELEDADVQALLVETGEPTCFREASCYAKKVLGQFGMKDCNSTKIPMEPGNKLDADKGGVPVDSTEYRKMIGCLRYLLHTRPDLSYSVGVASRFMENPTVMHVKTVKQILRYLHGTLEFGLVYVQGGNAGELVGYTDSDHGSDVVQRRSTGGMAFYLEENLITWNSFKQKTVSLSSCESEFKATIAAVKDKESVRVEKLV